MAISHNNIKVLDRASLAVSFGGLILAALTHQALFALTPLSINAILGLLRREGIERKNEAYKYASKSIEAEKDLLVVGLKLEKIERRIDEERTNTESKIVRVEQIISEVPKIKSIERIVNQSIKIHSESIKSSLNAEHQERLSPLELKLQKVESKIVDVKAEIDKQIVYVNEELSFVPRINSLEQFIDRSFQEQRQLVRTFSEEFNSEKMKLISGRKESQIQLIEALKEANERLIIVCPWIRRDVLEKPNGRGVKIRELIESALKRQVKIDIGWGHLSDLYDSQSFSVKSISRENFLSSKSGKSGRYDGIELLESLAKKHRNLTLKMLGTHEKYLVCDRDYAMIGSHNFLTSGDKSDEKELGLVVWNARTIKQLEQRYDLVGAASKSESKC